jgi:hypothetical protein
MVSAVTKFGRCTVELILGLRVEGQPQALREPTAPVLRREFRHHVVLAV